jgi:hypothetical protein
MCWRSAHRFLSCCDQRDGHVQLCTAHMQVAISLQFNCAILLQVWLQVSAALRHAVPLVHLPSFQHHLSCISTLLLM